MSKIRLACSILPQKAVLQTLQTCYSRKICLGPTLLVNYKLIAFNHKGLSELLSLTYFIHNLSFSLQEEQNEFIDAARLVYEGVREIRRAVLLNRGTIDYDSDVEWDNPEVESTIGGNSSRPESTLPLGAIGSGGELVDEYPEISGVTTAREAMKKMPEEDRAKIAEQVEVFRVEKRKFDIEVSKWDDNGNDIIVLAKHMCMIMMEMTVSLLLTKSKIDLQTLRILYRNSQK